MGGVCSVRFREFEGWLLGRDRAGTSGGGGSPQHTLGHPSHAAGGALPAVSRVGHPVTGTHHPPSPLAAATSLGGRNSCRTPLMACCMNSTCAWKGRGSQNMSRPAKLPVTSTAAGNSRQKGCSGIPVSPWYQARALWGWVGQARRQR